MAEKNGCRCIVKGCTKRADGARGMCMSCYRCALRLVRLGRTTWGEIINQGHATDDRRKAGKCRTAVGKLLAGRK